MKLAVEQRDERHIPLGAFLMIPLFSLPLGAWMVQQPWADFGTCALKATVGLPCLTCGATRATVRLLYGDLAGAFSLQPMIVLVYAALALWGLVSFGLFVRDKRARIHLSATESKIFKISLIVVPLVNWAYLIVAGV